MPDVFPLREGLWGRCCFRAETTQEGMGLSLHNTVEAAPKAWLWPTKGPVRVSHVWPPLSPQGLARHSSVSLTERPSETQKWQGTIATSRGLGRSPQI